ncbi:MAG: DNA primase [Magnetococcales bacterium]|nr:DNA primase [Magnetococcales bacterium]
MPRYPDSFIEEVRERIDLLRLVGRYVQLKKSGSSWLGLCPFHQEKSPSFNVRPDKGFFKCFGCGQGGDAFEFVMKIRGQGFNETVETLAAMAGLPLPVLQESATSSPGQGEHRFALLQLLSQASDYYHSLLMHEPGRSALAYLQARGLTEQIIQRFHLGYAPAGWQTLAEHFGKEMVNASTLLEEVGLRSSKGAGGASYDRFRDRVIFPIHDLKGRCVGFGGRTLDPKGKPKYINSPETILYQKGHILYGLHQSREAIQKQGELILVEGYMDLISLVSHGVEHCAATLGTALTDEQLRLIWQRTRRVVFCFDGDRAGREAAWRALEKTIDGLEADRHVRFLFLPQGSDPDQFIHQHGRKEFLTLVEKAVGLVDFLTERLGMDLTLSDPEGKAALVHRIRPYLMRISDPVLKELLGDSLARKVNVPGWTIFRTPRPPPLKGQRWGGKHREGLAVGPPLMEGRDVERTLLGILLRNTDLISEYEEDLVALELKDQSHAGLLEQLIVMGPELLALGHVLDLEQLPDEWRGLARTILTAEEVIPEFPEKELSNCLTSIRLQRLQTLNQQVRNDTRRDVDSFEESCRKMSALHKERRRLMASRGSQDQ